MSKTFKDCNFLNYLVRKHPNLYFELNCFRKNNMSIKLGRYTTRAILKTNKEDVLKDIKNPIWNKSALVREVKEFDKNYLFLFFPNDMKAINNQRSNLEVLVCKYPIKKRWQVLSQAFKQAYNKEIVEHLDEFEEALAKFFPEKFQQKWAEMKYLDTDDLKYIKYYDPKKAFKLLKVKINFTSDISQRGRLLNKLITVCYTNRDYSTYKEVLQYICIRHRNDDQNVRANIICHIKRNIDYYLITEVYWIYINELIDIQRVRGENLPFDLITEYLLFVYRNKLPLDGPVTQYAKDCCKCIESFRLHYLDSLKDPEAESTILKLIVKILPTMKHENKKKVTYEIMSDIVKFNGLIKNDKILKKNFKSTWINLNEYPLIMDLIKEVCTKQEQYGDLDYNVVRTIVSYNCLSSEIPLKGIYEQGLLSNECEGYQFNSIILDVIKKPIRNDFENTLLNYSFNNSTDEFNDLKEKAITHFLAKEPQVIADYFNVIMSLDVKSYCNMLDYGTIKRYSHLGLDKRVIAHFKALVSVDISTHTKGKLLNALSRVMNTKDFLELVKDYLPEEKILDLNNEVQRELYQVQCNIVNAFKNLDDISILAPVLMHFCQGDYLQSSLAAMYKVLYRTNEEQALSYVNMLGVRAMSSRKHAVYLGFELLPLKEAMTLYSELSNKEENISGKNTYLRLY